MGLKQCDKCSEMVDDAKAFCPGCGHAFVEEETRQEASNFEKMDNTVQFGQSMYNQMLSDMGLNITKVPRPAAKRVEVLAPIATAEKPPENKPPEIKSPEIKPAEAKPAGNLKWLISGGVLAVVVFLFFLAAAVLIFVYWSRFR